MGMIIRVAYNNQDWKGGCKSAEEDQHLYKCKNKQVKTDYKLDKKGNCVGDCWESNLCKQHSWVNLKGRFNTERANGKVFFVFPDLDNRLVIWGSSRIKRVDGGEVFFDAFEPLPQEEWVWGVSSKELLGHVWGEGTYRYTDKETEAKIEAKLDKKRKVEDNRYDDPIELEITDKEGELILQKHLARERSSKIVTAFKRTLPSFECCVCVFDFEKSYGTIGKKFIEAHHTKPVSSLKQGEQVSTKDLVAVCSNCHRMLHKKNPPLTWKELRKIRQR